MVILQKQILETDWNWVCSMGPAQLIASSTLHLMTERTQFPKDQALLNKMLDK
jgi:hypothetical protein